MYVYILRSQSFPGQAYVGITADVHRRLEEHNSGKSTYTSRYMPWTLMTFIWFSDEKKAIQFERYLKSGSGLAFRLRHF